MPRKNEGERWVCGVWTWNAADNEGEETSAAAAAAEEDTVALNGLCRRLGSGSATVDEGLYMASGLEAVEATAAADGID